MNKKQGASLFFILFAVCIKSMALGLSLESPAFINNAWIPKQYTCNGQNHSPALDSLLVLSASANKQDVLNAMQNHILDSSQLIGLYNQPVWFSNK